MKRATFPVRTEKLKQLLLIFSQLNNDRQPEDEKTLVHQDVVHVQ